MKSKILGVCGGNGVILHPFKDNLIINNEIRPIFGTPGHAQWRLNFNTPVEASKKVEYNKHLIDVIIGAPDCGHSSVFSYSRAKSLANPKENESLAYFIYSVKKYKPKVFMMENLPKFIENYGEDLVDVFESYRIESLTHPVTIWGNSQATRIRTVIIGIREDLPEDVDDQIHIPASLELKATDEETLLEGLGAIEIPNLCHVREPDDFMVHMFYKGEKKISVGKARELWNSKYKNEKKWPVNHGNLINQPGTYKNIASEPPLTVRKQNRQFNSQGYMLSPREMARIQGIPDTFGLWYDKSKHLYCINKARATVAKTPPYEIGVWFSKVLTEMERYF